MAKKVAIKPVAKIPATKPMKTDPAGKNKVFGGTVKPKEKPFGSFGGAKRAARASTVKAVSREKRLLGKAL